MSDCIFCQIVAGESPASIFYEDDIVLGLMTIGPVTNGHAMILPKKHCTYMVDMDEETRLKVEEEKKKLRDETMNGMNNSQVERMIEIRAREMAKDMNKEEE